MRTMAELESMYREKLQVKSTELLDSTPLDAEHRYVAFVQDDEKDSNCAEW